MKNLYYTAPADEQFNELTRGQKISIAKKGKPNGRLGYKHSEETKRKISQSEKGKKVSQKTLELMSKVQKEKKQSLETRLKISESLKRYYDKVGKKSKRPYRKLDMAYRNWRKAVFERDNYTCQGCGARGVYVEADHIKSWAHFPELRFELNNGRTLCKNCHKLTPNYKKKSKVADRIKAGGAPDEYNVFI